MAKFYGEIGFAETEETESGIYTEVIVKRRYYGDVIKDSRIRQSSGGINDNLTVRNQISIISDFYATQNLQSIRYVEFMGSLWSVTDASVDYPRLTLTLGGVYNGEQS